MSEELVVLAEETTLPMISWYPLETDDVEGISPEVFRMLGKWLVFTTGYMNGLCSEKSKEPAPAKIKVQIVSLTKDEIRKLEDASDKSAVKDFLKGLDGIRN